VISIIAGKLKPYLLPALLLTGIFFPSSLQGQILTSFEALFYIPMFLLVGLLLINQGKYDTKQLVLSLLIHAVLLFYTILTWQKFQTQSWGNYPAYVLLTLILLINLKDATYYKYLKGTLIIAAIGQIIFAYGIFTQNDTIRDFLLLNYSGGFDNLMPFMMGDLKPVTTYATHSVAAFFHFLFFFLALQTYAQSRKLLWGLIAAIFLFLLAMLRSNTAIAYTGIALLVIFSTLKNRPIQLIKVSIGLLAVVAIFIYYYFDVIKLLLDLDLLSVMTKSDNGILSRYATEGNFLEPTLNYIRENPLLSIGMNYDPGLFYTDSGFIIFYLRGSVFLAFFIYMSFYLFLKRNLYNKKMAIFLFFIFMLFEVGYTNLINSRTQCFIPFIIAYLNQLYLSQPKYVES
jgi:hypothetical protein